MSSKSTIHTQYFAQLIIWDWNGTLLNDANVCVESINMLLNRRNKALIDKNTYQKLFTFPVRNYYELIGFDFAEEVFEKPALEFMDLYTAKVSEAKLQPWATEVLKTIASRGFKQVIVSAMEQNLLDKLLEENGIRNLFQGVHGIDNHFGHGKAELAKNMISQMRIDKSKVIFIGDTIHDLEVSNSIGCPCIIFPGGHQSIRRLKEAIKDYPRSTIVDNLLKIPEIIHYRNTPIS